MDSVIGVAVAGVVGTTITGVLGYMAAARAAAADRAKEKAEREKAEAKEEADRLAARQARMDLEQVRIDAVNSTQRQQLLDENNRLRALLVQREKKP